MIEVENLSKHYAGTLAVNNVSFKVQRGEVVGFLGPNGAGKTTIMRILSGYIPASGGRVDVGGWSVFKHSMEVRKRIGYLPEDMPLYPEMRVDEYLLFRAKIKGLRWKNRRLRIAEVKDLCGLSDAGKRMIGRLSKGYRQRVGLADALVHNPELLILDEPTIGLDPNQIRQIRELIKNLAEHHTILLSTHILSEAEMTCQRVIILHEGRIVASDTPNHLWALMKGHSLVMADIRGPQDDVVEALSEIPHVKEVTVEKCEKWNRVRIVSTDDVDLRSDVFERVVKEGWILRELKRADGSLEDVFASLTRDRGQREAS
ncbi:MAG: ATP-binding cassette domain-containing protein [Kiritimatiellae bacterium]|nr:ATP-binding cassette domain-containing protein [Kiritimatiellia bacterium]